MFHKLIQCIYKLSGTGDFGHLAMLCCSATSCFCAQTVAAFACKLCPSALLCHTGDSLEIVDQIGVVILIMPQVEGVRSNKVTTVVAVIILDMT